MMRQLLAISGLLVVLAKPNVGFAHSCDDAVHDRDKAAGLYARGDLSGATRQIEAAIVRCPEEPFYLFMLGNAALRAGNFERAATVYTQFVARRPDDFEGQLSLGFAVRRGGDSMNAVHHWVNALR